MKTATLTFLKQGKRIEILSCENYIYIYKFRKIKYLVQRIGTCDTNKCKGACCRFVSYSGGKEYLEYARNFGTKGKNSIKIHVKCSKLSSKSLCSCWKTKEFPTACKQFPHPDDSTYHEVMDKCTFKFKILGELK